MMINLLWYVTTWNFFKQISVHFRTVCIDCYAAIVSLRMTEYFLDSQLFGQEMKQTLGPKDYKESLLLFSTNYVQ